MNGLIIHRSQLNRLIDEIARYKSDIYTFYNTYDAFPGDIDDAGDFFPGASSGNGDGVTGEWEKANYHLAKAGIIPDEGFTGTSAKFAASLISFPEGTKYIEMGWSSIYHSLEGKNVMGFGTGSYPTDYPSALLLPRDSFMIDTKIDDSFPKTGEMSFRDIFTSSNAACTNSSTNYYIASTVIGCNIYVDIAL